MYLVILVIYCINYSDLKQDFEQDPMTHVNNLCQIKSLPGSGVIFTILGVVAVMCITSVRVL